EAVARNPEVAQAMNDAGRSAAAAEELKRRDIAAEADATNKASLAVLRSAVAARQAAKAEKLSENAIKSRESEAANSTAARFISRHAVAVSTKEIVIAKLGDPYTQPPPANAAEIQAEIARKIQVATDDLDTSLRNGAAEKAGLRLDATTRKLMLDPAVAADSLINEAKMARRQLGKILGQSATQQKQDANDLQAEIIRQANEVKRAVEANGGDDMEGTLAAVASIERLVAIERAVTDAVLAKRETIQLTEKNEKTGEFIKYVRDQVEAAQKAAKGQGMDLAAQIAAGVAEATNLAQWEKNIRDVARAAKASADPKDKQAQIDSARKAVKEITNNAEESKDKIAFVMGHIALIESTKEIQRIRMSNIENPGPDASAPNNMRYNENLRFARIEAGKEIQDVYDKAFDEAARESIVNQFAIAAAAVKSYVLIEKSVIDARNAAAANIPALAAVPLPTQEDRNIRDQQTEVAKIDAEARVRNAANNAKNANAEKDPIEQYAAAAQAALREAGASSAEVYKAGREVEVATATMRDTVIAWQYTFAAAKSSAFRARIVEIERAIKGLTPKQAEEVRNTAKKAYDDATALNKDLIAQHADAHAANAGVRKAYELRKGNTDSKTLARVGNEARKAVEAAVASTEADIAKARGGTDIQTTTAKNAARCATAQADIAQAIKVVGPHARTRAPQLTELGHEPATTP
ncbi:MAG TPA: hypothetical protein VHV10_04085, partial [Ktedonobacteraceae bacterium]|nr:hypothetical protein [Ktedonobacteraceae bacterium]